MGVIFPILGALGMFYSLSFVLKTGCIDPGIVPRSLPDEIAYHQALGEEGTCDREPESHFAKNGSIGITLLPKMATT